MPNLRNREKERTLFEHDAHYSRSRYRSATVGLSNSEMAILPYLILGFSDLCISEGLNVPLTQITASRQAIMDHFKVRTPDDLRNIEAIHNSDIGLVLSR